MQVLVVRLGKEVSAYVEFIRELESLSTSRLKERLEHAQNLPDVLCPTFEFLVIRIAIRMAIDRAIDSRPDDVKVGNEGGNSLCPLTAPIKNRTDSWNCAREKKESGCGNQAPSRGLKRSCIEEAHSGEGIPKIGGSAGIRRASS